jgi:ribosome biogenesis GTPase
MNKKENQVEKYRKSMEKHIQKQQLRKARRQNRPAHKKKNPRKKKITPVYTSDWDDYDELALDVFEPIMPRGTSERRRKIEKQVQGSGSNNGNIKQIEANPDPSSGKGSLQQGIVIEAGSSMCRVDVDGEVLLCDVRGSLKNAESVYINALAVGDQVTIRSTSTEQGVVESVQPRRSVLARQYAPDKGRTSHLKQILVANLDQLLVIASWREPYIWPALIDRYLIAAQQNNIQAILCINKIDLVRDSKELAEVTKAYRDLGYPLVLSSVVTMNGIAEIKKLLTEKTTALAGLSGVGKSSILNAIQPELSLKVGKVSESGLFTGQGKHTTTQASLWRLDNGSVVIDTPGVRSFTISGIPASDLASLYPEMIPHSQKCRFRNCTHKDEPDCGVIQGVDSGLISHLRYKNYTQILEELQEG